ncbi:hypothetical protein ACFLTH_16385 [Bacteroidota bacterium]
MKKSTAVIALLLIFIVTFASRLMISFQTEEFSYDSYFALRQIENINEKGVPLFEDPLSFGGRTHLFPPVFYYLVSVFSFIGVGLTAKIIPNLLSALAVFFVYLISFNITRKRVISLITAFFSGFIPILFITVNDISSYSLVTLLVLAVLYYVMKIESDSYLRPALFLMILLVLSHASAFLLIIGLLLYLLLLKIESMEVTSRENEFILFSSFLVLWFNFIIFKKALLFHGPLVIWQNIPIQMLTNYFFDLNLIQSIYYIGIIPVFFGIYSIYHSLFKIKKKNIFLILSLFLSVLLLLWLKLVSFNVGLIFISLMLVILASHTIKIVYSYLQKTKMPNSANWFLFALVLVFFLTTLIPSFNLGLKSLDNTPSEKEIEALEWLKKHSDENDIILARPEEGHLINYFAERKTVMDENFLLIEDAQERYEDVQSIFSLRLKTEAVRKLNKYNVNYIYFSGKFGKQKMLYYADRDCFKEVYSDGLKIYNVRCEI